MITFKRIISVLIVGTVLASMLTVQADLFDKLKKKAVRTLKHETERELESEVERQVQDLVPSFEDVETFEMDTTTTILPPENAVAIYTTSQCPHSRKAVQFLQDNNIPYQEYDVRNHPKGKVDYKLLNGKGVPIVLAGDQRMNGFSDASMRRMLGKTGFMP